MGVADDLKNDLPVAMTMAAFVGAAWYICVELNVRLWFSNLRRKGLYFWSVFLGTQGVLTQPLLIILADFGQIRNPYVAFTFIYLSWWMLVVPQSLVLYSRLHLVISNPKHNTYVLYMIVFTTIFVSLPTMGLGVAAQASGIPRVMAANRIWDRVQVSIFFLQEIIISLLYIIETRRVLLNRSILGQDDKVVRKVMRHLIYTNILVVFLDCSLLGMSYSPYFYVQAAYKPCVYGVKLRVEFSILNRLASTLRISLAKLKTYSTGRTPASLPGSKSSGRRSVEAESFAPQGDGDMVHPSVHQLTTSSSMEDIHGTTGSGSTHANPNMKVSKPRFLLRQPEKTQQRRRPAEDLS